MSEVGPKAPKKRRVRPTWASHPNLTMEDQTAQKTNNWNLLHPLHHTRSKPPSLLPPSIYALTLPCPSITLLSSLSTALNPPSLPPFLTLSPYCPAMVNDEWVGAAMTNDMVVVELLIHLRQSQTAPKSLPLTAAAVPLSWGLKQPRSRLTHRWKDADSTRCSPNTPLSWSGAASPSVTADGCEESSRPSPVYQQAPRSKAAATAMSECTANSVSTKMCRKNKTFAELKEEESVLLKERIYLEKEIATLSATFKEQRARNESLKRIKLDLGPTSKKSPSSTSGENALSKVQTQSDSKAGRTESSGESGFLIPDLNMMPSEGDSSYVE